MIIDAGDKLDAPEDVWAQLVGWIGPVADRARAVELVEGGFVAHVTAPPGGAIGLCEGACRCPAPPQGPHIRTWTETHRRDEPAPRAVLEWALGRC